MFTIYINDLPNVINSKYTSDDCSILLYADDAKIIGSNAQAIQSTLTDIQTWMNSRQLSLAPDKFQHLPVQCNNSNCKIPLNTYSINSVSIASNVIVKDLGVFISCNLKWNNHVSFIRSKASASSYQY